MNIFKRCIPGYFLCGEGLIRDTFGKFASWRRTEYARSFVYEAPHTVGVIDFDIERKYAEFFDIG